MPLGLMTPIVAAIRRKMKLRVTANRTPANTIRIAPAMSMLRLPIRSAEVVIHNEMIVSPTSVSVRRRPICGSLKPASTR